MRRAALRPATSTMPINDGCLIRIMAAPPAPSPGKFDGGNFFVDNFYINRSDVNYTGLFGAISVAIISNTGITGNASPAVTGSEYVGALAGLVIHSSVSNCYAHVAVRCESHDANVIAYAGGLLGWSRETFLSASYSSGNVSGNLSGNRAFLHIGGLAGVLEGTVENIRNCFAAGDINAVGSSLINGGGLEGLLLSSIANCYATGNVLCRGAQTTNIGVLFGNTGTSISTANCYRNSGATITNGDQPATPKDSSISTSKTKAEMQTNAFRDLLNSGTSVWGRDGGKNDGLPYIIGVGVGR